MTKIAITSGEFRGRQISTPDTNLVHPMGSRERLALFNALESLRGPLAADGRVMDCFCGSGALGLEALSRGAREVVFVDQNTQAITTVKQNIADLQVKNRTRVIKSSFMNLPLELGKFDILIADPPYDDFPASISSLGDYLAKEGVLVLSHPAPVNPAELLPGCELVRTKKYAAANLSFFVKHNH